MFETEENNYLASSSGLFSGNELESRTAVSEFPAKAYPVGLLEDGEEILPEARNVAEIYQEVNGSKLNDVDFDGDSTLEQEIEEKLQHVSESEVVFCFWGYTGSFPISKTEAQTLVLLSKEYSEVITPPLQHDILRAILYEDTTPDIDKDDDKVDSVNNVNYLRLYRIGIERYLEAARGSSQILMAPIPFLRDDASAMTDQLLTYEEYDEDIEMICLNLHRRKPTSKKNEEALQELVAFMKRWDIFDNTLKYAINVRHSYATEDDLRSAEDLTLAGLGFDIIGENHWRPHGNNYNDYEVKFRLFDLDVRAYREFSRTDSKLEDYWPQEEITSFSIEQVEEAESDDEIRRLMKLMNAERIELALLELREEVSRGEINDFPDYVGVKRYLSGTLDSIVDSYNNPEKQLTMEDFS